MCIPSWLQSTYLQKAIFLQDTMPHHMSTQTLKWVSSSHQISNQQSTFKMRLNTKSTAWMGSWHICSNCMGPSCQHEPVSLRNVLSTSLNLYHEEFRLLWGQRGGVSSAQQGCESDSVYFWFHIFILTAKYKKKRRKKKEEWPSSMTDLNSPIHIKWPSLTVWQKVQMIKVAVFNGGKKHQFTNICTGRTGDCCKLKLEMKINLK